MIYELPTSQLRVAKPELYRIPKIGDVCVCDGTEYGPDELGEPHFIDEGYTDPKKLYLCGFVDTNCNTQHGGYYCADCLTKLGFNIIGRQTAQQRLDATAA